MATVVLVAAGGLQLGLPLRTELPQESELAARRAKEPAAPVMPDYPTVLDNPIFAPDRKPDASAVPVAGGMNGFAALGVLVMGTEGAALVRGPGGLVQHLKPGDEIQGWKLVTVETDRLTFERNRERRVLMVQKAASVGPIGLTRGQQAPGAKPGANASSDDSDDSDDNDDNDN